jgi:CHASE3 domain sensor protein
MRSRPVRRYLWLLVAVLLSAMLAITAVSLISLRAQDVDIGDLTTVVGPAYELNASILQTMTNAETGLRGYLVKADPVLLEQYNGAEQQVDAAEGQLTTLLASPSISPAEQRRDLQLQSAQDVAISRWWTYATYAKSVAAQGRPWTRSSARASSTRYVRPTPRWPAR